MSTVAMNIIKKYFYLSLIKHSHIFKYLKLKQHEEAEMMEKEWEKIYY